jgi:chromosome segregation ATPase
MDELLKRLRKRGSQHGERIHHALRRLQTERLEAAAFIEVQAAEIERLQREVPKFPEHMEQVLASKREDLPPRVARVLSAMEKLPEYFRRYQWAADTKSVFGEKFVRTVAGDNGRGTGRQWIATTPHHIDGLAEYIAAASPDTFALLISERDAATARVAELEAERGKLREALERTTRALDEISDETNDAEVAWGEVRATIRSARAALSASTDKKESHNA